MRRFRLFLLTVLVAALAPAAASAACPLGPNPVWAEWAGVGIHGYPVANVLARPGNVLAVGTESWADDYRAAGAETAGWHMRLAQLVGTTRAPFTKSKVRSQVPGVAAIARRQSSCDPPWITINEMMSIQVPEPLSWGVRRYRENILLLATELHQRGIRTFILLPRIPLAGTRYKSYWRALSRRADLVYEAYTWSTLTANRLGDAAARGYMRRKWTDSMKRLKPFVVSMDRAGIVIPYWSRPARAPSGREGLSDARWFRAVRLRTQAAGDVARAMNLGTVWSWGWQTNPKTGEVDPDKRLAACYYLQARDPSLCDPATL